MLKGGKRDEALLALKYAFADEPRVLSDSQKEFMLEVCDRLMVISVILKDDVMAKKYGTLSERTRRSLGWNIEKYNQWHEPIFVDTCARMGIKK